MPELEQKEKHVRFDHSLSLGGWGVGSVWDTRLHFLKRYCSGPNGPTYPHPPPCFLPVSSLISTF